MKDGDSKSEKSQIKSLEKYENKIVKEEDLDKPLTGNEDIGKAVTEQYQKDEMEKRRVDSFRINKDGEIMFDEGGEQPEATEINYTETLELDQFLQIDQKLFSVKEIENLLRLVGNKKPKKLNKKQDSSALKE